MAPSWMFPDGVVHPPGDPGGKSIRVGSSSRGMRRAATGWTGAPRPTGRPARPVPVAVAVVVVGRPVVVVVVGRPGAPAPAEAVVVGAVEVVIREEAPAPEAWVVDGPAAAAGPREPEPEPDPLPEPLATAVVTPVGGSAPPKPARAEALEAPAGPPRWMSSSEVDICERGASDHQEGSALSPDKEFPLARYRSFSFNFLVHPRMKAFKQRHEVLNPAGVRTQNAAIIIVFAWSQK